MDLYQRIGVMHCLLKSVSCPIGVLRFEDELGCSAETIYHDVAFMRNVLMAPIEGDGETGFFYLLSEGNQFELPGVWFNSEELYALLAMQQQLVSASMDGLVSSMLLPLQQHIENLLAAQPGMPPWQVGRVRVISHRNRKLDQVSFRIVASALLERKQLGFYYRARSTDEASNRVVSPQCMTHYRGNWYLDAWDHGRQGVRSFAVDRVYRARIIDVQAHDLPDSDLEEQSSGSYGIFSGLPKGWATIVFSSKAARWVADEYWHVKQRGRFLVDGRYELQVPYSISRELLMDVLHYGSDAEIVEPPALREQAKALLSLALSNYE